MSWPPLWVTGGPPVWCLLKSNVVYSRCGRYTTSPVRSLWGWLPFTSGMGMSECALVQRVLAAALVKPQGRIMAGPFPKGKTSKGCNYQKMGKHWIKQNQQTFLNWSLRVCVCVCEREQGREKRLTRILGPGKLLIFPRLSVMLFLLPLLHSSKS